MLSDDDKLWLGLAAQLGFLSSDVIQQVLADTSASDAAAPLAMRFVRRGLLTAEDLEVISSVSARVSRVHGTTGQAIAFLSTQAPAVTAPWLSMGNTVKSGEHPRPIDSLDGLDFVVPELDARYRHERGEELGRGGLGRVVTVRDQVMGREVAMKQLLPERSAEVAKNTMQSVTLEARFLREARLAAQLEHPNIVPVFEVGRRPDGSLYYTMRRIKGRTLADAVRAAKTMPERLRLVHDLFSVSQALAYAHSRGVIHRDVKPQNIMLGGFGETYLLDWGLARIKGKADPRSQDLSMAPDITGGLRPGAVGTPSYMSPEQALGRVEQMDERTDVWGLGAVLYEVLTGRPPYVGDSAIQVIQQVVTDDWAPVKSLSPDAPSDLVAVCTRALAKDPAQRYASAKELSDDLEAWLHGRRVSAREYSGVELMGRLLRRNPVASALVATLVVALLGVGTFSLRHIRAQRNAALQFASFAIANIARNLYDIAGAEPVMETLARETARFLGEDSGLNEDDPDTRFTMASAWFVLGQVSSNAGRFDAATGYVDDCVRLLWREPRRLDEVPAEAALALRCLVLREIIASLRSPESAQSPEADAIEEFLVARADRWPGEDEWQGAMSSALGRLHRRAMRAGDAAQAKRTLDQVLALDERRAPTRAVPVELVSSLRDAQLLTWTSENPDAGLALGERALALTRTSPRRLQNGPLLRAWVAVLTQHIMLLKWSGRAADATALLLEGDRVAEQLLSVDGDRMLSRGIIGDYFIETGRAARAEELLLTTVEKGARSDYFTSYLLAAVLAGDTAAVLARRETVEAATDGQAHLLWAVALALTGDHAGAAKVLREWGPRIAKTPMQWPRGCFEPLAAATPAPLGPALRAFSDAMEAALPADDSDGQLAAVTAFTDALEAMAAQDPRAPAQAPR
jgi:tRNA A-37 threonylcarbamoyl transferase component Bud32